jgi:hypothetical protein
VWAVPAEPALEAQHFLNEFPTLARLAKITTWFPYFFFRSFFPVSLRHLYPARKFSSFLRRQFTLSAMYLGLTTPWASTVLENVRQFAVKDVP